MTPLWLDEKFNAVIGAWRFLRISIVCGASENFFSAVRSQRLEWRIERKFTPTRMAIKITTMSSALPP